MYSFLSAFLPLFVMPVTVVLMLLVAVIVLFFRGKRRAAGKFLIAALLVLWVTSMPLVANTLMGSLERVHPVVALQAVPAADCMVLLGGMARVVDGDTLVLNDSEDRFHVALGLMLARRADRMIVTSGTRPRGARGKTEAEAIKAAMVDAGVPESAVLLEMESANTRQNALNSKTMLDSIGCDRPLLVTSASHMPRAAAAFARVGVSVFPVPAGRRAAVGQGFALADLRPSLEALAMTSDAMHEWLGRIFYRLRGWG